MAADTGETTDPAAKLWKEHHYLLLLKERIKPDWWNSNVDRVNYKFLSNLFEYCYSLSGSHDTLIRSALLALDDTIKVPLKISNLKRTVSKFLIKKGVDVNVTADFLYDKTKDFYVGKLCNELSLTTSVLDKLIPGTDFCFKIDKPLNNGLVIELYHYIKGCRPHSILLII